MGFLAGIKGFVKGLYKRLTSWRARPKNGDKGAPPPKKTPEEIVAGKGYSLLRKIGEGGCGRVWLTRNPDATFCALKIVPRRSETDGLAYEREITALKRLKAFSVESPCIINIYDIIKHDEFVAYTMALADDNNSKNGVIDPETYEPKTLRSRLDDAGRLPVAESVDVGLRVVNAIQTLHSHALVHRDIKPGNIVYIKGLPVVADIGLVINSSPDVSQVYSEGYRPPEGVGKQGADIYAIGKLLYVMATGYDPNGQLRYPDGVVDARFVRLNHVILISCDEDPQRRYINCKALHRALEWVVEADEVKEPVKTKGSLWKRITNRGEEKTPDTPQRANFKAIIRHQVVNKKSELISKASPQRTYLEAEEFNVITEDASREIERRLGIEPPEVTLACQLAQVVMEPSLIKKMKMLNNLLGIAGGIVGLGMIVGGIGMALGWGQGMIAAVIAFFTGAQLSGPLAIAASGLAIATAAGYFALKKDNPEERTNKAVEALIRGVHGAIDVLWDKHHDQFSI